MRPTLQFVDEVLSELPAMSSVKQWRPKRIGSGESMDSQSSPRIVKLTGVYDANGSLAGELAYWMGARFGKRHCALCEITHGLVRTKPEWREARDGLPVEFTAVHLDERDPAVAEASRGQEPCVVASREDGSTEVVIRRSDLEACEGDPLAFAALLRSVPG